MRHTIRVAITLGGSLLVVLLLLDAQLATPQTFASLLSPPVSRWGIHLGNHVYGEPGDETLLSRIDGSKNGIWPDTIVFLTSVMPTAFCIARAKITQSSNDTFAT